MTPKEILPAVAAAIFNPAGEILLQKRKDVDAWGIISGHVEFGETLSQAVLREIKEETGTEAAILRLIGVYSSPSSQLYRYNDKTVHYITTYFEAQLLEPIVEGFSNEETAALQFFPTDALPKELAQLNPFWLSDALNKNAPPFIR